MTTQIEDAVGSRRRHAHDQLDPSLSFSDAPGPTPETDLLLGSDEKEGNRSSADFRDDSMPPERQRYFLQRWPRLLLTLMFSTSIVLYYDRGAFAGTLPVFSADLKISESETGLIAGSFIVGYALFSPIATELTRRLPRPGQVLLGGLTVWIGALVLVGFSTGFWSMLAGRCLVGVGEAGFMCVAPVLVDNAATPIQRSRWLALFFCSTPIGFALGYIGAGSIAKWWWPAVFFSEAVLMVPFALLCFFAPPVHKPVAVSSSPYASRHSSIASIEGVDLGTDARLPSTRATFLSSAFGAIWQVLCNRVYLSMTLGFCAYTFVFGALTTFVPAYVVAQYGADLSTADYVVGGVTLSAGLGGNLVAGIVMEMWIKRGGDATFVGIVLCLVPSIIAIPFAFGALYAESLTLFFVLVSSSELMLLCTVTPINAVLMSAVEPDLRPVSMGLCVFMIHALGDVISPYIYGSIAEHASKFWALWFTCAWMFWIVICWTAGLLLHRRSSSSPRLNSATLSSAQ